MSHQQYIFSSTYPSQEKSTGDFQQCEMEIASAPPGLESSINLLFTQDCLEFLSKLHHTFNGRINMVQYYCIKWWRQHIFIFGLDFARKDFPSPRVRHG